MTCSMTRMLLLSVSAAVIMFASAPGFAAEQDQQIVDQRGQSVKERARPGYDAAGIRAGSFLVFPEASVGEFYNDNIYATDTNEVDDFITKVGANVAVKSNWNRHALNLNGGLVQSLYADRNDEDRLDWNLGGNGRIDVTRDTKVSAGLSFQQLHEDRGDPNSPAAASEPVKYNLFQGEVNLDQRFNRVTARVGATYSDYNYKDVPAIGGGAIDQDFRDRKEYEERLRLGYDVSPDTNVYVQGSLNQREYDQQPPAVALNRDSDGYAAIIGSDFRFSNLARGGVFVGYQEQNYDSAALSDISGITYGANVDWFVTPLTTIGLTGTSTIEETTTGGSSGYVHRTIGLSVDHELLRNLILSGNISYANDDYASNPRQDDVYGAGLGVNYLLNRNVAVGLEYGYTDRNSNISGNDYTRNLIGLTLTGKL